MLLSQRTTRGALHPPDGETTQPDTGIMGVAGETPTPATGRLMFQLQAKGEEKGEHTFDKRFAVAQQLHIGRFVLKINGDSPVFAGLTGSGSHGSPSGQMVGATDQTPPRHPFPQWSLKRTGFLGHL